MITRMLAAEWATHNVNVNAIAPSLIMSEMAMKNVSPERREMFLAKSPLKRLAKVEDVAGACVSRVFQVPISLRARSFTSMVGSRPWVKPLLAHHENHKATKRLLDG